MKDKLLVAILSGKFQLYSIKQLKGMRKDCQKIGKIISDEVKDIRKETQ